MGPDAKETGILHAIVSLGRHFGLVVTAEGVETPSQHRRLCALRRQRAQGFHFARPLPAQEAEALLATQPIFAEPRDEARAE